MIKRRTITLTLFTTGILLFLTGFLLAISVGAAGEGIPALQPSPRPPWDATMTPAVQPTTPPTPTSPPPSPTPTPTPTPIILPLTGGATYQSAWLLGLGAGFVLLGLSLTAFGKSQHQADRQP